MTIQRDPIGSRSGMKIYLEQDPDAEPDLEQQVASHDQRCPVAVPTPPQPSPAGFPEEADRVDERTMPNRMPGDQAGNQPAVDEGITGLAEDREATDSRADRVRALLFASDIVIRYGESSAVPKVLTDYIAGREAPTNQHGRAGSPHATFVPDEIVDRFCVLGPADEQIRRLRSSARGVDRFAVYLQHDAKDETLRAYGEQVLPAIAERVTAKG